MKAVAAVLMDSALFADMPEEAILRDLVPRGCVQAYRKGQFLIEPRQEVARIGVILSGAVHVMHIYPDGDYGLISVQGKTEALGADLVCTRSRKSPYHAAAVEDTSVIWFPAELITRPGMLAEAHRLDVLGRLLTLISQDNMRKEYRLAILSQNGLRERVMTYLAMQADRRGTNSFTIPFDREELAAFLCVNRSALSHELSRMQKEGLIRFRKNVFTLVRGE